MCATWNGQEAYILYPIQMNIEDLFVLEHVEVTFDVDLHILATI
jgi:hypothetical protein